MTFKPKVWFPIAAVLSAVNVVAAGFAAGDAEPWHAGIHAALGVAFALWAQRLLGAQRTGQAQLARLEGAEALQAVGSLESEMDELRRALGETQERLDFAERMLAQRVEPGRRAEPR